MEIVTLAQSIKIARADRTMHIEQTIANIYGPCSKGDEQRNPEVKMHAGRPRKGERPHHCDRGCVEVAEMP